jgi:NAD(P)-dependent dehydrogenase (short-subunit alcohol dehydrogenase family)
MELSNCHAIVTGGASGLGAATSARVIAAGGKATILDRDVERGEAKAKELGDHARFRALDVTDEADAVTAIAESIEAFGPITLGS